MGEKVGIQPANGYTPNHVALYVSVIQVNNARYWLYAAVDPATNRLPHVGLFPTRTQAFTEMFLTELREKHHVDHVVLLVDSAP